MISMPQTAATPYRPNTDGTQPPFVPAGPPISEIHPLCIGLEPAQSKLLQLQQQKQLVYPQNYKGILPRNDVLQTIPRAYQTDIVLPNPTTLKSHHHPTKHTNTVIQQSLTTTSGTIPHSSIHQYIHDWLIQYRTLHPHRRPLLTYIHDSALDDTSLQLITTYIQPTRLPYHALYDLQTVVEFLSQYIEYTASNDVSPPVYLPLHCHTPAAVCTSRTATALELALVGASLLAGVQYHVYVVSGYASKDVTQRNLKNLKYCEKSCTDGQKQGNALDSKFSTLSTSNGNADPAASEPTATGVAKTQYTPYQHIEFHSKFDQKLQQPKTAPASDKLTEEKQNDETSAATMADNYATDRVHFWLLVVPNGTHPELEQPIFVEPSTGQIIAVDDAQTLDSRYFRIESIFNRQEYYVNMRPTDKVSSLQFDFSVHAQWEVMFTGQQKSENAEDEDDNVDDENADSDDVVLTNEQQAAAGAASEEKTNDEPHKSQKATINDTPNLQLPPPYGSPLHIPSKAYLTRLPHSVKTMEYADATVKLYASYSQPDGRVKEVCRTVGTSTDIDRHYTGRRDLLQRELLQHTDANILHTFMFSTGLQSGLQQCQKTMDSSSGNSIQRYVLTFNSQSRADKMQQREVNLVKNCIEEQYRDRDDRLTHTILHLQAVNSNVNNETSQPSSSKDKRTKGQAAEDQASSLLTPAGSTKSGGLARPVTAIIQRYARNTATAAEKDIRQIQYNLTTGTVDVSYHYHAHSVLDATHRFDHRHETSATAKNPQSDSDKSRAAQGAAIATPATTSSNGTTILSSLVPPVVTHNAGIRHLDDTQLLRSLAYNEKQLKHQLKEHEIQMNDLYQWCRSIQHQVTLNVPIAYQDEDVLAANDQLKNESSSKNSASNQVVSNDYLSASLLQHVPSYNSSTVLTRKQAVAVRDTCLNACKERMLNRASVIQQHVHQLETQLSNEKDRAAGMSSTTAASAPQQANSTTSGSAATSSKPQSITKSIEELQFKLGVAQQRQKEHEEHSLRVYLALENELSKDSRLTILYGK